ncbi:hypothetical protein GQ457_09G030310 [Hibiscus cannabinus]
MKDLIKRKPSIAELTGISESRLGCLQLSSVLSPRDDSEDTSTLFCSPSPSTMRDAIDVHNGQSSSKSLRSRYLAVRHSRRMHFIKNLSFPRITARDKLRRRGDNHLVVAENLTIPSPITNNSQIVIKRKTTSFQMPTVFHSLQVSSNHLENLLSLHPKQCFSVSTYLNPSLFSLLLLVPPRIIDYATTQPPLNSLTHQLDLLSFRTFINIANKRRLQLVATNSSSWSFQCSLT